MNNIRQQILSGELRERRSLLGTKRKKGADAETGLTSVEITREEQRTTHMREDDRHRLRDQKVRVVHKRRSYTVELVNLSGGGAMISADFKPKLWDRVDLFLHKDGKLECAVRWLKGNRIGLEFAHETRLDCSEEARAKLLKAVIDQNFTELEIDAPKRRKADEPAELEKQLEKATAEDPNNDLRDGRRHPLVWRGSLHYDFQTIAVRLRNISETGVLIECQSTLPVGAEPLLDLGDAGQFFGTVTWVVGDQIGLKFNEPFDLHQLANSRPEVASTEWEAPSFVKRTADDSAWDDGWERLSLDELRDQLEGFLKY